jgi:hypothetical protein
MNKTFKRKMLGYCVLPKRLDSFTDTKRKGVEKFMIEYDGFHFEGSTMKSVTNKVLKYIFAGGKL